MSWLKIGKAFSDIENPPTPSRPLIISRCRIMGHFNHLWYPKSLFLSNFVLLLVSFYSSIMLHTIQYSAITASNPHLIWCLSISLIFWDKKPKNFRKCHSFFFRSPSLPCLFTLRPLASIWIFHILALITIFFFLVMRLNADTIMYPNRKHFNFLLWKSK